MGGVLKSTLCVIQINTVAYSIIIAHFAMRDAKIGDLLFLGIGNVRINGVDEHSIYMKRKAQYS